MTLKKVLLLLLAAVMTLCLMACGNDNAPQETTEPPTESTTEPSTEPATEPEETTEPPTEPLVFDAEAAASLLGAWELEVSISAVDMGIEGFDYTLTYPMQFVFGEDGIFSTVVEAEAATAAFQDAFTTYLVESLYAEFANQELDKEAANEAMKEQYDMTVEEYAADLVSQMGMEKMFESMSTTSTSEYYVRDGKLYSPIGGGEYEIETFTVEGDTLTFVDSNVPEVWEMLGVPFPATFTRVPTAE